MNARLYCLIGAALLAGTSAAETPAVPSGDLPPAAEQRFVPPEDLPPGAGLRFVPPGDPRLLPPGLRLSFSAPADRTPALGSLLSVGPRRIELNRAESTLKGVQMATSTAAFLGAVSASYDLWDEKKTWWMVGGAAALGALYGGTAGWKDAGWRASVRWSED